MYANFIKTTDITFTLDPFDKIHRSGEGYKINSAELKVLENTVASINLEWKTFGTGRTLPSASRPAKLSNLGEGPWLGRWPRPRLSLTEFQSSSVEMGEPSRHPSLQHSSIKGLIGAEARRKPLLSRQDRWQADWSFGLLLPSDWGNGSPSSWLVHLGQS